MFLDFPTLQPIRELMLDPQVSEIMINWPNWIYVERRCKIELTALRFLSNEQLRWII